MLIAAAALALSSPVQAQVTLSVPEQDVVLGETEMIGALYMVVALHEYCRVQIPEAAIDAIGQDARRLEERMGLTSEQSETSYQSVLQTTVELAPACIAEQLASALGSYAEGQSPFGGL